MNLHSLKTSVQLVQSHSEFKKIAEDYKRFYELSYDVDCLLVLEGIIERQHDKNEDVDKTRLAIWGNFYGECLIQRLHAKWDDELYNIILWNGSEMNPFQSILGFIAEGKAKSLADEFTNLSIQFANSSETDTALPAEKQGEEKVQTLLDSLGLTGFKPLSSADEFVAINIAREAAKKTISKLEMIDPNVKEYEEYKALQPLGVLSEAFKMQLEKVKTKVAENGDADKMMEVAKAYCLEEARGDQYANDDMDEVLYWVKKAAVHEQPDALFIAGQAIYNGIRETKDKSKAKFLMHKACEKGNEDACEFLRENFNQ